MNDSISQPANAERCTFRECFLHGVLLLLVVACLFPGTFLQFEHTYPGELLYKYEPWSLYKPLDAEISAYELLIEPLTQTFFWYAQANKTIEAGEWPLWNPLQYCGLPLLANFQSAVFYPPRIVYSLFDFLPATTIFILLRVWLCGATAYVAARGMGLGVTAARFASIAWMLCMYNMVWTYWPVPDVSAWAPIVLLGVERAMQARYRQSFFAIAAGGTLLLLAGHPETAFTFGMGIGTYLLIRLACERRTGKSLFVPMLVVLGGWIPALLLCAIQLIPFLEYVANSYTFAARSESKDAVQKLLSRAVVSFWVPRFFGANVDGNFWGLYGDTPIGDRGRLTTNTNHVSYVYVGMVTWVVLLGAFSRIRKDRLFRHRVFAVAVPGLTGLLLALDYPLLEFVHHGLFFGSIVRTYYVNFLLLGLVFLAAMGVESLVRERFTSRGIFYGGIGVALFAIMIGIFYAIERPGMVVEGVETYVVVQIAIACLFGILTLSAFVLRGIGRTGKYAGAFIVVLLTLDLLIAGRGLHPTSRAEHIPMHTALFDAIETNTGDGRVVMLTSEIPPGASQMNGIETVWGYDAITPLRVQEFLEETEPYRGRLEPILSATHYVFPGAPLEPMPARFRVAAEVDGFTIYENTRALPRAFLVGEVEVVGDREDVFARMAREEFDPARTAVTDASIESLDADSTQALGNARVVERRSTFVQVDVEALQRCALVLTDAYYPGWNVYVDGLAAAMFPVDHAFRGVLLPQGKHEVVFRYEPRSFRIGLQISVVTGVLSVVLGALWILRRSVLTRRVAG